MVEHKDPQFTEPNLEKLLGSNSTLKLACFIEDYVSNTGRDLLTSGKYTYPSKDVHPIYRLQKWAESVDRKIVAYSATFKPKDEVSVIAMVNEMVKAGKLSQNLPFLSDRYPPGLFPADHYRWELISSLFGIDTTILAKRRPTYPGTNNTLVELNLPSYYKMENTETTADVMLKLIRDALSGKGSVVELRDEYPSIQRTHIAAPTALENVFAIIRTTHSNIDIDRSGLRTGYPSIESLDLHLGVAFLAAVRPLTAEQYEKYVPSGIKRDESATTFDFRDHQLMRDKERRQSARARQEKFDYLIKKWLDEFPNGSLPPVI